MSQAAKDPEDDAGGVSTIRSSRGWAVPALASMVVVVLLAAALVPSALARAARFAFGLATPNRVLVLLLLVGLVGLTGLSTWRLRRTRRQSHRNPADGAVRCTRPALPWTLSVALIAAVAIAVWYSLGRGLAVPRIFADELIYMNAARGLAGNGSISGHGYGLATPIIDATAFLVSGSDVTAYRLIQALNVCMMACAAFPAYLLARRVISHGSSLAVAVLTVAVPWMVYARFVMTEAAFYPVFLLFVLVLVRALERPSLQRQLVLAGALTLAFSTRTQAVALAGAVVGAVILQGTVRRELRAAVQAFRPTWLVFAVVGGGAVVVAALGKVRPLGAYSVLLGDAWHPHGLLLWVAANVTSLSLGLGVLVCIAAPLGAASLLRCTSTAAELAFAAAAVPSALLLLLTVAVISVSPYGQGAPHERNLFFAAPLVFICALAWAERGFQRPPLTTGLTLGGAIALAALMPGGVITSHSVDALSFKLWLAFPRGGLSAAALIVLAVAGGAVVIAFLHSSWPLVATVAVAAVGVAAASDYRSDTARSLTPRYDWVDRRLPDGARAAILWVGADSAGCPSVAPSSALGKVALYTEFFNSTIGPVGHLHGDNPARGLASDTFAVRSDGVVTRGGDPLDPTYAVTDARVTVAGRRVATLSTRDVGMTNARERSGALALWRIEPPLRLVTSPGGAACNTR